MENCLMGAIPDMEIVNKNTYNQLLWILNPPTWTNLAVNIDDWERCLHGFSMINP